ncbi:MAG: hypothetical protein HY815_03955 [Candidatus Riflebacteria bacterium]|nr:hypothetical protein [Candidatus Riflebacteria bacterium]
MRRPWCGRGPGAPLGLLFLLLVQTVAASIVQGATTRSQTLTIVVSAINELAVSGVVAPLVVSTVPAPGSEPSAATDSSTAYSLTTNSSTPKAVTAVLNQNMPAGVTLSIALQSPPGSSPGDVALSTTAQNVLTGVSQTVGSSRSISYTLSALVAAGVVSATSRTVTLTLQ